MVKNIFVLFILIPILIYAGIGLIIDIIFVVTLKLLSNKFNVVDFIERGYYNYMAFNIDIFTIILSMPVIWPIWILFFLILITCYIGDSLIKFINSEKAHDFKKDFFNMRKETDEHD